MEKYVYIKKSIAKHFVDFTEPLSSEEYNNLGETWQDYLNNKWVLLSDGQASFYIEHPTASVKEIWDMQLEVISDDALLQQAKKTKLSEISTYDNSPAVNSFSINGADMWLTVEERQRLATQINANEAAGRENMTRWFNGTEYTFPVATWKQMLVAVEVYAGDALNVTEAHKAAVNALTTKEEVEAYDYTTGYPTKIEF